MATYLGLGISAFTVVYAAWAVFEHLLWNKPVQGWTSTVVLVSLFASVQLLMTGILGEYVGRIYDQSKHRPLYVIDRIDDASTVRPARVRTTFR